MDIVKILEDAKAQIKAEEERQVKCIKEQVMNEIQPKYVEIDNLKNEELNRLAIEYNKNRNLVTEQYNAQLVTMQNRFEEDKKLATQRAEDKKKEILNSILTTQTYPITRKCEKEISKLDAQIKELKG